MAHTRRPDVPKAGMIISCNFNVQYLDILLGLLLVRLDVFYPMDDIHTRKGAAEDGMLVVEPRLQTSVCWNREWAGTRTHRLLRCDEELRTVRIWAGIGHAECVRFVMLQT
jgi:hypothetical protein